MRSTSVVATVPGVRPHLLVPARPVGRVSRLDVVVAAVVTAGELASLAVVGRDRGSPVPVAAYAVLALAGVPLAFRRMWPVGVWLVVTALTAGYGFATWPDPPLQLPALIALYTVALSTPRTTSLTVGAITLVLAASAWLVDPSPTDLNDVLTPVLATSTAWLAGAAAGAQRRSIELLEERARRLEDELEEHAARIVAEERLRIARELHDVTAHHVTVMAVQAEGAAADPSSSARALAAISASARLALADLRRMLSVLRTGSDAAQLRPQPGLVDLPELVEHVRAGGLEVDLVIEGDDLGARDGIGLAAYRIVQEALTNVVRHAGATQASVTVDAGVEEIVVEVIDDGRGSTTGDPVEGHGLRGIRERAALYRGVVEMGSSPAGFRVKVRLRR
jgi:signal transduction histidine kinase